MSELLILHSYPYDRPDAAQRATSLARGSQAVLNVETDEWDILVDSETYRKAVLDKFGDELWGTHVGCASQARKAAKKAVDEVISTLGHAADRDQYETKDLEGL